MSGGLPPATAFLVRQGAPLPSIPRFAAQGELVPVDLVGCTGFTAAGDSPERAATSVGAVQVLVAGEFYNTAELSGTAGAAVGDAAHDAEVLAHLYEQYGAHAFRLINGRYAAVVLHGEDLVAATDHVSGVALFVSRVDGVLTLATEAKALFASVVDSSRAQEITELPRVRGPFAVHRLRAGTVTRFAPDGSVTSIDTWRPPEWRQLVEESEAVTLVRETLGHAVRRRIAVRDEVAAVLSGGIDSSTVASLICEADSALTTVTLGTEARDEFAEAALVAGHLAERFPAVSHRELKLSADQVLGELARTVWASESTDPDIVEYLLPLTALYRRLPTGTPSRILTGYGADIPLGGMHRISDGLGKLEDALSRDMATFDGLNEMVPALSMSAGYWTTHPYWDRDVLDLLTRLSASLKLRHGRDKWVLREAMAPSLPQETVARPKLGVHEGSGSSSALQRLLKEYGLGSDQRSAVIEDLYDQTVVAGTHPDDIDLLKTFERLRNKMREDHE